MNNPFFNRTAIDDPAFFFDRTKVVRTLFDYISQNISCSIIGQRRIGKSSLLNWLMLLPETSEEKKNLNGNKSIFVFIDFQRISDLTREQFWIHILNIVQVYFKKRKKNTVYQRALKLATLDDNDVSKDIRFAKFEVFLREIVSSGYKIIFVFDEFEHSTRNQYFDFIFYAELRSLVNIGDIAYITSTTDSLYDLTFSQEIKGSPFFNIFQNVQLSLFTESDIREMIISLSQRGGIKFSEQDIDFILSLSGYFPFFVQLASYFLYNSYVEIANIDLNDRYAEVEEQYNIQAEDHYKYFWKKLSDEEQDTLRKIASAHSSNALNQKLLKRLVNKGLLHESKGEFAIFSNTFHNFIKSLPIKPSDYLIRELPAHINHKLRELIVSYFQEQGYTLETDPLPIKSREVIGDFDLVLRKPGKLGIEVSYIFLDIETSMPSEITKFDNNVKHSKRNKSYKYLYLTPRSIVDIFEIIQSVAADSNTEYEDFWCLENIIVLFKDRPIQQKAIIALAKDLRNNG